MVYNMPEFFLQVRAEFKDKGPKIYHFLLEKNDATLNITKVKYTINLQIMYFMDQTKT